MQQFNRPTPPTSTSFLKDIVLTKKFVWVFHIMKNWNEFFGQPIYTETNYQSTEIIGFI